MSPEREAARVEIEKEHGRADQRTQPITHEQAMDATFALINTAFNNSGKRHSRHTVPAQMDDDDVLLTDYIKQQAALAAPPQGTLPKITVSHGAPPAASPQSWIAARPQTAAPLDAASRTAEGGAQECSQYLAGFQDGNRVGLEGYALMSTKESTINGIPRVRSAAAPSSGGEKGKEERP